MKYKNIEKVQLVLPPPRRPDTITTKFATLPQPFARYAREFIFWLAERAVYSDMFATMLNRLIPHQPQKQDNYIAKFARWPQPLGIVSLGTYIRQNNPGVDVEILDGNNVLTLDQVIDKLDADVVGISTTAGGYDYAIKVAEIAKQKEIEIQWIRNLFSCSRNLAVNFTKLIK